MNIGWYTRDGDLEFFSKVSLELMRLNADIHSYYLCHTLKEEGTLQHRFDIHADVLGEFIENYSSSTSLDTEEEFQALMDEYPFMPMRKLVWGDMYELGRNDIQLKRDIVSHFRFFEKFCLNNKLEVILSEGPGILATNILWTVC